MEGIIVGMCNPLLDITAIVGKIHYIVVREIHLHALLLDDRSGWRALMMSPKVSGETSGLGLTRGRCPWNSIR